MKAGFKNGVISLDEKTAVYYAGQEISGAVHFKLNTTLTFRAINLQITGNATVQWIEKETIKYHGHKQYGETLYKGNEEYFNNVQVLCGGQGVSQLQPQSYTLSFKFQLPHTVPSSFKGVQGNVSYNIIAFVEFPDPLMPWEELIKEIQVIAPYDLNNGHPSIKQPTKIVFDEMYSSCCLCSPSPVNISIELPASGFCPGDTVPVSIKAVNDSGVKVLTILLQISMMTRFRSQRPRAELSPPERTLVEGRTAAVRPHSRRSFTCDLKIPQMLVYNLRNCSIIDVTYYFKATLKLSGCQSDRMQLSEIYLGMIPLNKKTIQLNSTIVDRLPKGPLPDPSTPTTPGITTFEPGFKITPVPAISGPFQNDPNPYVIGFKFPIHGQNQAIGNPAPYSTNMSPRMFSPGNLPSHPLPQPSAPTLN